MRQKIVKLLLLCYLVHVSNCAKILAVFPVPSFSHQAVFRPVMKELARRGHEVTVITPLPDNEQIGNFTEVDVSDVSIEHWKTTFFSRVDYSVDDPSYILQQAIHLSNEIFIRQVNTKIVQDILKSDVKFDLVFIEAAMRTCLMMAHIYDAPAIQFSSFFALHPDYPHYGSEGHPLIYPEKIRTKLNNLTLWDKFEQLYIEVRLRYLMWRSEEKENAMLKQNFGPDAPTIQELIKRSELLFLNNYPIFEGNRAVPPAVIHLGGLHQNPYKELPEDLKSYLDASKHGVIYMSFGTNVDPGSLPPERIQVFCRVFSRLPYDVLWKWNEDVLPGKPDNVRISKWLPQSDLLRHPKIKLFITQGGLQSTDEAITAGVPLLTIPIVVDQLFNAERHVKLKIGMRMNLPEITDDNLEKGIRTVINDPSYRQNMELLRTRVLDQPQTPLEKAIWWTEYLLRHKTAKHLRSPMANITWTEYLMLDVVAVVLALLVFSLFVTIRIVKIVLRMFDRIQKIKTS